jgi:hypothetical protein
MSEKPAPLIAPRPNEDDDEQRFREAMERLGGQMIATLDSAIGMRTASPDTQRSRHLARGDLVNAMLRSLNTYHMHRTIGPGKPHKPRSI